jgi:1,4-dihydroxy-2-naphthoate octaprenyltransferase
MRGGLNSWLLAVRPKTLPTAVGPVLVGNALAYASPTFSALTMVVSVFCAVLLQASVNLANDYFDFVNGIDTAERLGPVRVTQSGLIPPVKVRNGMLMLLSLAILTGLYLVWVAGWPLLIAGLLSVFALLAYSGGPFPIASNALGDLAVFVFYGPVAVVGACFVQGGDITVLTVALSVPVALPITAVLVVNNLRDIPTDERAGKKTLAVRLGDAATRRQFAWLIALPFALLPLAQAFIPGTPSLLWLPLVCAPAAWILVSRFYQTVGAELNAVLAHTAAFSLLFCLLLAAGILMG